MEKEFIKLNSDEVIHAIDNSSPLRQIAQAETFKVELFIQRLEKNINKGLLEGVECEVMTTDQTGWQKGKVRIKQIELEFCPQSEVFDQDNSPLDELRSTEVD